MKPFTLSAAKVRENAANTNYPQRVTVTSAEDLRQAARFDHVAGILENNSRKNGSALLATDAIIMDIDNAHTAPWTTPAEVAAAFPGVEFWAIPSRNHMRSKDANHPAAPRHHYYFPLRQALESENQTKRLKERVQNFFPEFDPDALDGKRFIFGVEDPKPEHYHGETCLDEFMGPDKTQPKQDARPAQKQATGKAGAKIPQGQRNTTIFKLGCSMQGKGLADAAILAALDEVNRLQCDPPLPARELQSTVRSVLDYDKADLQKSSAFATDDRTDVAQARLYCDRYCDQVKYTDATGWLVYTGSVWEASDGKARELAQKLTDVQLMDAKRRSEEAQKAVLAAMELGDDEAKAKAEKQRKNAEKYFSYVCGRRSSRSISATLTEARPLLEIKIQDLDADPYLLNTPAGTVDLRTGETMPNDPRDLCTKITTCAPGNDGAELFAGFLEQITSGDRALAEYLQTVAGMALIGAVFEEKLIIAYGPGGNGKSTFFNLLLRVMGSYASVLQPEILLKQQHPGSIRFELADLRGLRLAVAPELEDGSELNAAAVKRICSTDTIKGERKHRDSFTFQPSHSTVLFTNYLPKVDSQDSGTWDRLVVVPFTNRFRGSAGEVKNYAEVLERKAGPACLAWMIEGAQRFVEQDYTLHPPACVLDALTTYRHGNDWAQEFLDACCILTPDGKTSSTDLFSAYRRHCLDNDLPIRTQQLFTQAMKSKGYTPGKMMQNGTQARGYKGIKLA